MKRIFVRRLGFTLQCSRAYNKNLFLQRSPYSNTLHSRLDTHNNQYTGLLPHLDIRISQQTNLHVSSYLQP